MMLSRIQRVIIVERTLRLSERTNEARPEVIVYEGPSICRINRVMEIETERGMKP